MSTYSNSLPESRWPLRLLAAAIALGPAFAADAQDRPAIRSEALKPPAAGGEHLFTRLEPGDSGIDFQVDIDVDHPFRRIYEIAFAGTGVAIGDYDDDGRPDLFMTHHSGPDRLFRQTGDMRFEDVTETAGLGARSEWSAGTVFVDVNNDGLLDLYVCYYDAPNSLFINQGDGSFVDEAPEYGLDYQGASVMAAFADYDRDGDLDMYLVTSRLAADTAIEASIPVERRRGPGGRPEPVIPAEFQEYTDFIEKPNGRFEQIASGQPDLLFINENGRFRATAMGAISDGVGKDNHMGMSALWWDFNNDRWPDLYVANDLFGPDRLYRNNGDGSFTNVIAEVLPHTPWYSMGSDYADINNDGAFDLLATDMSSTTHYEAKVGMGDMDSQTWFLTSAVPRQYMRNSLYINTGMNRFMEAARLAGVSSTDWTWSAKLNDFDNDGFVDLYISNGMVRNFMDADVQNEIEAAAGLDDYWEILKKEPPKLDSNLAFRNYNGLQFEKVAREWGLDHRGMSFGAAVGDLDRDGDLDLVVANLDEPVSLYRNESAGGNRVLLRLVGTRSNRFGLDARVAVETAGGTQYRQLSPVRGFMSGDEPLLHVATGDSEQIARLTVEWPSGSTQVFADLPTGRLYTVTEPDLDAPVNAGQADAAPALFAELATGSLPEHIHRELAFDDYALQPLLPAGLSRLGPGMAWGDADGDGDEDVYIGGAAGTAGQLYIRDQDGRFSPRGGPWEEHQHREDMGVLWFDADGDGDQDLLVASGSSEFPEGDARLGDRLYLNDGEGRFVIAPASRFEPAAVASSAVVAGDFDADGDLDVFIGGRSVPGRYPLAPSSRLLRNESGVFVDVSNDMAVGLADVGMVSAALWSDYDDDGDPDLLVALEWGPVRMFRNESGRLVDATDSSGVSDRTGWWNSIESIDADNDGDLDYVVGNVGLNSKYHASREKPATLYYGDMSGAGVPNLIEVEWEEDTAYPVRGLSCSSDAMPFLADKFKTFDSFARADIQALFAPERLRGARQYSATELASGILINDGSGSFEFRTLPLLAQLAPVYGIAAGDFDLDGNNDIFAVQNSFAPQPETGRFNGGVGILLQGDGTGNFEAMWPNRSGLLVAGDAKSLTVADLNGDGRPDFLVAQNDDRVKVFTYDSDRRDGETQARAVRIAAEGPIAGTRIDVIRRDGSRTASEIHAGSGYLSQSPPLVFIAAISDNPVTGIEIRWPSGEVRQYSLQDRPVSVFRP